MKKVVRSFDADTISADHVSHEDSLMVYSKREGRYMGIVVANIDREKYRVAFVDNTFSGWYESIDELFEWLDGSVVDEDGRDVSPFSYELYAMNL